MTASASTIPLRAALYLRVSTARQAEHDVSIPDQRKQGEAYCFSRGYGRDSRRTPAPPW
jgi:DNA invertase Pin-like site-specific DNA recombinase